MILFGSLGLVLFQIKKNWDVFYAFATKNNMLYNQNFAEMMAELETNFYMTVWVAVAASVLACAVFTVLFSHKVAGPMHKITIYFKDIVENGHKSELRFREGDLHKEVPVVVNAAIGKIKEDCAAGGEK